jgi:hypothetical protein
MTNTKHYYHAKSIFQKRGLRDSFFASAPFQNKYWSANRQCLGNVPIAFPPLETDIGKSMYLSFIDCVEEIATVSDALKRVRRSTERRAVIGRLTALENKLSEMLREILEIDEQEFDQQLSKGNSVRESDLVVV